MNKKRKLTNEWLYTLPIRVIDESQVNHPSIFEEGDAKDSARPLPVGEKMVIHPAVLGKRSKFFLELESLDHHHHTGDLEFIVPGGMTTFSTLVEFLYSG